jgi:general secretion pathway protein D
MFIFMVFGSSVTVIQPLTSLKEQPWHRETALFAKINLCLTIFPPFANHGLTGGGSIVVDERNNTTSREPEVNDMKRFVPLFLASFATTWLALAEDATNASDPSTPPDPTLADAGLSAPTPPLLVPKAAEAAVPVEPVEPDATLSAGVTPTNGLILNFRDAPLSAVLNYLSARAGFIIISDIDLKGKVSVVAKQPVTTNEVVDLLSTQLARNNYAVTLNGRTLTIMDAAGAKTSALTPVLINRLGPTNIPRSDKVVTEILPLRSLSAAQLVKDLTALIPQGDTVTANESGNSLIMTASQKDVRRISEIIAALDGSALSDVAVFPLKFADAKSVASELKEIFQTSDSEVTRSSTRNVFGGGGPGGPGGGPGGPPGFFGGGGGSSSDSTKNTQTHAVFVSDDQMNAIVASAPPDYMPTISNVIAQLDLPSQEVTQIRVFHLRHADPTEIADELSNLFPSSTGTSDQNNRSMGFQFNPFPQQGSSSSSQSARAKRQSTVLAVADRRTESVIVTASKDLMTEIKGVIADLDESAVGVQHVYALAIEAADPSSVQETMSALFASSQSKSQTSTTTALQARMTANNNSQSSTTSTSSGFGSSSGGLGGSSSH